MEEQLAGGHQVIDDALLKKFLEQFDNLKKVVKQSSARLMGEPPDELFYIHQNVFVKSYLVSACSVLEAFIQDLASAYVDKLQAKINSANLPFNLVIWIANHDKAKLEFKIFEAKKNKKDISDLISPNYWKTMHAFERVGIDLSASDISNYKDFIASTVDKRNKIVHYNDEALDLSFFDVVHAIDQFSEYAKCLFEAVCADRHLGDLQEARHGASGN